MPLQPSISQNFSEGPLSPPDLIEDTSSSGVDEGEVPDTTIRLIGGGGQAGTSQSLVEEPLSLEEPPQDPQPEAVKESEVIPVADTEVETKKDKKTHKRSKSSIALKRISQLGGLRKKDSKSSMKEAVSPSLT
jgi:hypothetical protein